MTKAQRVTVIVSGVLALLIVAAAVYVVQRRHSASYPQPQPLRPVTHAELARSDGKNGHTCLVAVDGMVYKIEGFAEWQNGVHTPSGGLAYCGADLSNVIDQAPHGRKVLDELIKVGPLKG